MRKTRVRSSCPMFHGDGGSADWLRTIVFRERSLTIGGGGSVLFQRLEPKNVSPSQVNSPKILAPFKMWAQKIVTLPCEKLLIFLRTLFWDNYFTGIRKKCYYFNTLFTKPNGSPSKGNPYIKQPRCYSLNSCFVVNFKSEQIVRI